MSTFDRPTLKNYFLTNLKPTQAQFGDLIDSCLNIAATAAQTIHSDITVSGALSITGSFAPGNISTGIVSASTLNSTGTLRIDGTSTLVGAVTLSSAVTFGSTVAGFSTVFNNQVGTTYTLVSADTGKTVTFTNAASVAVALPNNMGLGFTCECIQGGAGVVQFIPNAGAALQNRSTQTHIAGQFGAARLTVISIGAGVSATYNLAGDTA